MALRLVSLVASRWLPPRGLPRSRLGLALGALAQGVALLVALRTAAQAVRPTLRAPAPAALPDDEGHGGRFGVPAAVRQQIFAQLAAAEPEARASATATFPFLAWSREDQRAALERDLVRAIASQRGLNLTQVYLILDEGIRARTPGPAGPLEATVAPLDPRRR